MESPDLPVESFAASWANAKLVIEANIAAATPHLAGLAPEQVDEYAQVCVALLQRQRAPKGFGPVYHVARVAAATAIQSATNASNSLAGSDFTKFSILISSLNQIASATASMSLFGERDEGLAVEALAGRLSEGLALLNTAQSELASKKALLEASLKIASAVKALESDIAGIRDRVATSADTADEKRDSIAAILESIDTHEKDLAATSERAKALVDTVTSQKADVDGLVRVVSDLRTRAEEQQRTIDGLLPKGASAGLAYAFGARVTRLDFTKWLWMAVFVLSIAGLVGVGYRVTLIPLASSDELWRHLLHRLPLLAPFVWLGWFSAVQYGNTIRLQEDYAFKEATSKAFVGYRDHMAFMHGVSSEEGNTALHLLVARTIDILGTEPLRSLQASHKDASPTHQVFEAAQELVTRARDKAPSALPSKAE